MLSLILISLAANAALAYGVFQLRTRLAETERRQVQTEKDIEEMFSGYLLEMEEQNRKLADVLTYQDRKDDPGTNSDAAAADHAAKSLSLSGTGNEPSQKQQDGNQQVPEQGLMDSLPVPPIETDHHDTVFSSVESQAFHLHEQGYSAAEIAKKLNRGKTEIELILKFQQ
ncbi:DUF6115 domain-containing protein [Bacillus marinisedimentorum]|uniref:DUF6115 domain-containing protein n=1 Tax=Bacillus marinisedimentorum TaxID=1821260 RepID=UPI0007E202AF|nr:hypothetical protein [Bacillus marinisedimentorum]